MVRIGRKRPTGRCDYVMLSTPGRGLPRKDPPMRPPLYKAVPITELRRNAAQLTDWVRHTGGHLWIAKHGSLVAGVVPMHDIDQLENFRRHTLAEHRARLEENYARWKRVKALSDKGDSWDWETAVLGARTEDTP